MTWTRQEDCGCLFWNDISVIDDFYMKKAPVTDINTYSCPKIRVEMPLQIKQLEQFEGTIENAGHGISAFLNEPSENTIFNGEEYRMIQFHFHSPSEHTIDDEFYQLELHLVHQSVRDSNRKLIIAVFFDEGESSEKNAFLEHILDNIPKDKGVVNKIKDIDLSSLDFSQGFWHYSGSLTKPPCSEFVSWIIMKKVNVLSKEQYIRYTDNFKWCIHNSTLPYHGKQVISVDVE